MNGDQKLRAVAIVSICLMITTIGVVGLLAEVITA